MHKDSPNHNRLRRGPGPDGLSWRVLVPAVLAAQVCTACAATGAAQIPNATADVPPDAVIEVWAQSWTLNDDGSQVYHEKKYTRLNSDRVFRALGDPRITYNADTDQLEVLVARTRRPDGTYVELADYAHVLVSPDAAQRWPAFASIRQHLLVMPGLEPGCTMEVEYRITRAPGSRRSLAADVRLDSEYPVELREIRVQTPTGTPMQWTVTGLPSGHAAPSTIEHFTLRNLPACSNERYAPPWQERCARLAFTTGPAAEVWLAETLGRIEAAADHSDLLVRLAREWTEEAPTPSKKLEALQKKLTASFNFVNFPAAWQPAQIRPASVLIQANYGLPAEAAALLLGLARAVALPVQPVALAPESAFLHEAPQEGMITTYGVVLDAGGEREFWHPHDGRILRDAHWAGHAGLWLKDGELQHTMWPAWTNADESRCEITGHVTIANDGTYAGELWMRTTGLFVPPESLASAAGQKKRVQALVEHVLPDAQLLEYFVETQAPGSFVVTGKVKSGAALKKAGGAYLLELAERDPLLVEVPLPPEATGRKSAVQLTGAFDGQVTLEITWPASWSATAQPAPLLPVEGDWGVVAQEVEEGDHALTLRRRVRLVKLTLSPEEFATVRGPLNELRSAYARTLLLLP